MYIYSFYLNILEYQALNVILYDVFLVTKITKLSNELLGPQTEGDEVAEVFDLCLCNESVYFLYIFGTAEVGKRKKMEVGDALREEKIKV